MHRLLPALLALFCSALLPVPSLLAQESYPIVDGVVTAIESPTVFDIDGRHILLNADAKINIRTGQDTLGVLRSAKDLYLGERVQVFGRPEGRPHPIHANRILILPLDLGTVTDRGIVEAVLPPATPGADLHIQAAGYRLIVPAKLHIAFVPPSSATNAIQPNMWIAFEGMLQQDGTVVADKVLCADNSVSKKDKKLIEKTDYDPAAIDPDTGQTPWNKTFLGIDPKKIPPYEDHAMQARLTAVGEKLIPPFQRNLKADDPTRIHFRFQLIDEGSWHQPLTLGSGIILVPFQLVDRMQNDSQLAAILSYSLATAFEKQAVDTQTSVRVLMAEAGLTVAGLTWAPATVAELAFGAVALPNSISAAKLLRQQQEERLRVSLFLLHDAGYDVDEAPHAWWLLSAKKKDIAHIAPPRQSVYLYQVLGLAWHPRP
jgi:hypothetical protein